MILVTGSGGVLGHALAVELARQSEPVHLVTSRDADLTDPAATIALLRDARPRIVYHLAGRVHGLMGNRRFPADMFAENIRINTNVIEAASRCGCEKIVAMGTVSIYGSAIPMPAAEHSIFCAPPHPAEAAYAHAKRAMLAQLEAAAVQHGLAWAYPILTNLYGPHDRFDTAHGHVLPSLVAKFHDAARTGLPVEVWGSGTAERDFLYSGDAARALVMIGDRYQGPINVATGHAVPIRTAVDILQRLSGVDQVVWDATKPDGQLRRRYDVTRLDALGFRPQTTLEDGLASTWAWYGQHTHAARR